MSRYLKVKRILDDMRPQERRICTIKEACACTGCASSKGIKKHELELYLKGELK